VEAIGKRRVEWKGRQIRFVGFGGGGVAAERLHDAFQFGALVVVAVAVGEYTLNASENVCEWPDGLKRSELADPVGEEGSLSLGHLSVGEDAGTDAGKLIDCFGDVVLEVGFEKAKRLSMCVLRSREGVFGDGFALGGYRVRLETANVILDDEVR